MRDQVAHRPDRGAEGHAPGAAEEQAVLDVAAQRGGELVVDAELPHARVAVAQPALRQALQASVQRAHAARDRLIAGSFSR